MSQKMNSKKEERVSRLLPPSALRTAKKENLPAAIRVPARRITYMSSGSALKPPTNINTIKTASLHNPATSTKSTRTGGLWKGNSNSVSSSKTSIVRPLNRPSTLLKDKPSTNLKSSNKPIPLPRNNKVENPVKTQVKTKVKPVSNKQTKPLQETKTKGHTTTIPLRKSTIASLSKVNTAPKTRTCTTVHKDTQPKFKLNPASLEEILSSRTASDADKKRSQTLIGRGLRPKSTVGTANRVTDLSRSRMTYSYRVKKPSDSRASLYTGALRLSRTNHMKKEPRKSLIASKVSSSTRVLSTIRESRIPPKLELQVNKPNIRQSFAPQNSIMHEVSKDLYMNKHNIRQSFATPASLLMTPARRYPSSIARRTTTSYMNKGINVLGSIKANRLTMLSNLATSNHHQSIIQQKDSEITSDSLLEPMKNLKLRRLSRKPITMDDLRPLINNVTSFDNNSDDFFGIKDTGTSNIVTSTKMDEILELAASIPLPPSPVSDNKILLNVDKQQKLEGDKESPNGAHLPTVEEFRLFEELEKLEKRLEQEISEGCI
ncbi:7344_t:CDS:2 [Cetraspora pellucida]|uniref:7344_t:CDS:1 n=1 Tax=Cetraspora pellucida TaxID=1433469 RepID=A0ACA9LVS1_9GLOM|nr:7344_t:CDS:2 [Cetraspora pellucida]